MLFSYLGVAQNYSPLHTESTFNDRSIDVNLPVGTLAGSAGSAEGAASYTIPIKVAPGSNGMVPSVSVSYNSMGGSGIAGYGWNISAASAITRVGQNIYFDGKTRPLKLDNQDRLVLDGQRLIKKSGSTYMGNGTTYGKEMEDYSTVTAHGQIGSAPEWFEVVAKDGTKYEYGRASNSRMTNLSNNQVFSWHLNKVTRTDGNYMEYIYNYNSYNTYREIMLLQEIKYTGNANVNRLPYNTVKFYYNHSRIDENKIFLVGTGIKSNRILDRIQVKAENQYVRHYKFKYAEDDVNSFLKEVIEYGSDYSHFNSTIFKYGDKPVEFEDGEISINFGNNSRITYADVDGDGRKEIVEQTYSSSGVGERLKIYKQYGTYNFVKKYEDVLGNYSVTANNNTYGHGYSQSLASDFTGDGRDDILITEFPTNDKSGFPRFLLYKSTSDPSNALNPYSFAFPEPGVLNCYRPSFVYDEFYQNLFTTGDFDGDGATDFAYFLKSSQNHPEIVYIMYMSFPRKHVYNVKVGGMIYVSSDVQTSKISSFDFDGDGKLEIQLTMNNSSDIIGFDFLSNGNINGSLVRSTNFPGWNTLVYYGDFNGDGKTDFLSRDSKTNNNSQWKINLSTGTDYTQSNFSFNVTPDIMDMDDDDKLIIGDFNGDGKSDIYHGRNTQHWEWIYDSNGNIVWGSYVLNSENTVYYSKGNGFVSKTDSDGSLLGKVQANAADLNGDSRMNVINRKYYNSTSKKNLLYFNKDGTELLLSKVKNGLNHESKWDYKRMNQGPKQNYNVFYKRSSFSAHPINSFSSSMYLVERFEMPDGIGGVAGSTYSYRNAKLHKEGKGFLGFETVKQFDIKTNNRISSNKLVVSNPPMLVPSTSFVSEYTGQSTYSTILSKSVSNASLIQIGGSKRYKYQMNYNEFNDYFNKKRITSNVTYDNFGNPTNSIEKTYAATFNSNGYVQSSTLQETRKTTSTYGVFNTPVPAKPILVTSTITRNASNEQPYTTKTKFVYWPYTSSWGAVKGNLRQKVEFDGLPKAVKTIYYYYPDGNLKFNILNSSGMTGRRNWYYYDSKGRYVIGHQNPLYQSTSKSIEPKHGNTILEIGVNGLSNGYEYDGFGRLKKTKIYAPGSTTTVDFETTKSYHWADPNSNPKSVFYIENHHPEKPDSKVWYDIVGRKVKTETKGFQNKTITTKTNYSYLQPHNRVQVEQIGPYKNGEIALNIKTKHDRYGRVYEIEKNGGFGTGTTSIVYDQTDDGLKTTITTPDNKSTSKIVDHTGKVIESTDNGGTLKYYYYSHGNMRKVKNGVNLVYNYYDAYARQTKMIDKNAGTTHYVYDNFGQLVSQTTANGKTSTMKYDKLGRMTEKVYFEGKTTYSYYPSNNGAKTNQIKKITKFLGTGSTIASSEEFNYSTRGLLNWKKVRIPSDNLSLISTYTFNNYGDMTSMTYPSGFGLSYELDANGYLEKIKKKGTSYTLFENKGMNGYNQLTKYKVGNLWYGPEMNITYEFGIPKRYYDIRPFSVGNQDLIMGWNNLTGNLTYRRDMKKNKRENFYYDNLNRLKSSSGTGIQTINTHFSSNGNITSKTDAGNYFYQSPKINAVTGINAGSGSAIPTMTQDITYTSFLQPKHISEGAFTLDYTYGADEQRIKSITKQNNYIINSRYYFNGWERDISLGITRDLHYVSAGGRLIAIVERKNGTDYYHYTYTDHLGSIVATCSASGYKETEQNFDAWGRKRNPTTWSYSNVPNAPVWLYRGYTGHEGLKNFRLINMNGRMYDPVVGRMLSVDNYIQAGGYTQSYNRYSYAFNNPLKYDDPDGEWVAQVIGGVFGGYSGYRIGRSKGATGFKLMAYTLGGTIVGALSGGLGSAISTSGVAFANTASIIISSSSNSLGMFMMSGGTTDMSVSFGVGSFNFSKGELGYFGKEGNSISENIGYGFGALANVQDIFAGKNGTSIDVRSRKELAGHSEINNVKNGENILVSVGPSEAVQSKPGGSDLAWEAEYLKLQLKGQTSGGINTPMIRPNDLQFRTRINNVNSNILTKMTSNLNNGKDLLGLSRLKYGLGFGCVNYTSRALLYSGIPTINAFLPLTSPVLLNFELAIRQGGIYASPYLSTGNY